MVSPPLFCSKDDYSDSRDTQAGVLIHYLIINAKGEDTMATERREVCTCDKCGNEAEMTIKCEMVEIPEAGVMKKKQKETRVCKVCGNEADLVIDFDE